MKNVIDLLRASSNKINEDTAKNVFDLYFFLNPSKNYTNTKSLLLCTVKNYTSIDGVYLLNEDDGFYLYSRHDSGFRTYTFNVNKIHKEISEENYYVIKLMIERLLAKYEELNLELKNYYEIFNRIDSMNSPNFFSKYFNKNIIVEKVSKKNNIYY